MILPFNNQRPNLQEMNKRFEPGKTSQDKLNQPILIKSNSILKIKYYVTLLSL
jgi:hypothetical protein